MQHQTKKFGVLLLVTWLGLTLVALMDMDAARKVGCSMWQKVNSKICLSDIENAPSFSGRIVPLLSWFSGYLEFSSNSFGIIRKTTIWS